MRKRMCFTLAMLLGWSLNSVCWAQSTCPSLLQEGVNACQNMEYDEAIRILNTALMRQDECSAEQLVQVRVTLATALIAQDDEIGASAQMREALQLDPDLCFPDIVSPKIRDLLDQARSEMEREAALKRTPSTPRPSNRLQQPAPAGPAKRHNSSENRKSMSGRRIAAWSTLGMGGALAAGSGITFGVAYQEDRAQKDAADEHDWDARDAHWNNVKTYATASYILAGLAGASLTTSLVLFLTDGKSKTADSERYHFTLMPIISPERKGLAVLFRF